MSRRAVPTAPDVAQVRFPNYMKTDTKDLIRKLLRADTVRRIGCSFEGAKRIKRHKVRCACHCRSRPQRCILGALVGRGRGEGVRVLRMG